MTDVKSKNLYELLGNTSDQDSDREPEPPTQTVDKQSTRHGKREAPKPAPAQSENSVATRGRGGDRRGGFSGSEAAFRDRATGRNKNHEQSTDEPADDSTRGGRGRGRGRGGPRRGGDRHSRTGVSDHQKQVGHGWGETTGQGEWQDEKAGEEMAKEEKKEGVWDAGNDTSGWKEDEQPAAIPENGTAIPEAEPEPEDNSKSYADYVAEQAAKKLEGLGLKQARAPNEGSKENKKWKSAKELLKGDDEDYFKGEDKSGRQRDRKHPAKEFVDIDYAFKEQAGGDTRGGRGRGRGGRGRGGTGDRGDFRSRGRGGRGEFRGGDRGERGERGDRGDRGDFRGESRGRGRGRGDAAGVAVDDKTAFPSLGGK